MRDNARALAGTRALYYPFVERTADGGKGLSKRLADDAAVVVTDDFPAFFLPRMIAAAGRALDVSLEAVDGNGLLPLAATDRVFTTAASFRRFLHKTLPDLLQETCVPVGRPVRERAATRREAGVAGRGAEEVAVGERSSRRGPEESGGGEDALADLPIDHSVGAGGDARRAVGGAARADGIPRRSSRALRRRAQRAGRRDASSGLSPYLHFGHISVHEVFSTLMTRERWTTRRIRPNGGGASRGMVGRERGGGVVSRRADHVARDRHQHVPSAR